MTRQQTRFLALMQGYDNAAEYAEKAANSIGVSAQKMEIYEESLEAKSNRLTAAFEKMATSLLPSGLIGFFLDFEAGILNALSALGGAPGTILATVSALLILKAALASIKASTFGESIERTVMILPNLLARLNAMGAVAGLVATDVKLLGHAFSSMTQAQILSTAASKSMSVEQLKVALTHSTLDKAIQKEIIAQYASAQAKTANTAAGEAQALSNGKLTLSLGSVTSAIWANVKAAAVWMATNPAGWVIALVSAIGIGAAAIHHHNKALEESAEKAKELEDAYHTAAAGISDDVSTLKSMSAEFDTLSQGVDAYGKNISLSSDEYERYHEIVNKVAQLSPSLISGYDEEGNAIAKKNDLIEKSIALLNEEKRLQMEEHFSDDNFLKIANGKQDALETFRNKNTFNDAAGQLADGSLLAMADIFDEMASEYGAPKLAALFGFDKEFEQLGGDLGNYVVDYYDRVADVVRTNRTELLETLSKDELAALDQYISDHAKNTAKYQAALEQKQSDLNPTLQLVPQMATAYQALSDAQKDFITEYINGFRLTGKESDDELTKMRDDILDFTNSIASSGALKTAINDLFALDPDDIKIADYDAYVEKVEKLLDDIEADTGNALSDTQRKNIKLAFGVDVVVTDENGNEVNEKDYLVAQLKEKLDGAISDGDLGTLSVGEAKIAVGLDLSGIDSLPALMALIAKQTQLGSYAIREFVAGLDRVTKEYELLSKAQKEMSDSGYVSLSTVEKMTSEYPELVKYLELTKDGYRLTSGALKAYIAEQQKSIQIAMGQAMSAASEVFNAEALKKAGLDDTTKSIYAQIEALKKLYLVKMADYRNERLRAGDERTVIESGSEYLSLFDSYNELLEIEKAQTQFDAIIKSVDRASAGSGSKSKSKTELYVSELDKLYESKKKLAEIQGEIDTLEAKNDVLDDEDYLKKIENTKRIIELRRQENEVLHQQNELIRSQVAQNVEKLRGQGFVIDYAPASNQLLVRNMERVNQLKAGSVEATNKLRKAAEELLKDTESLNDMAKENSLSWHKTLKQIMDDTDQLAEIQYNAYQEWETDQKHRIELLENQGGHEDRLIAMYQAMKDYAHAQAEAIRDILREQGKTAQEIEDDSRVQALASAWWEYEKAIQALNKQRLDDLNDLLDLTKDMIKQEKEDEIDALERQVELFDQIIERRKESLRIAERERGYEEEKADKTKQLSKLQARADALALDDSRSAAIELGSLLEEIAKLQKELDDTQREHSITAQEEALDKEKKDFEDAQDEKINQIKKFLKNNEALTKAALNRLDNMNDALFKDLLSYALHYTDTTGLELQKMWDKAKKAAQEYGSITNALSSLQEGSSGPTSGAGEKSIVSQMISNSAKWKTASSDSERRDLEEENNGLAAQLSSLLKRPVVRGGNGVWYYDRVGGPRVYHSGGVVGEIATPKQNELFAMLQKGEMVLTQRHQDNLLNILSSSLRMPDFSKILSPITSLLNRSAAPVYEVNVQAPVNIYGYADEHIMGTLESHGYEVANIVSKRLCKV